MEKREWPLYVPSLISLRRPSSCASRADPTHRGGTKEQVGGGDWCLDNGAQQEIAAWHAKSPGGNVKGYLRTSQVGISIVPKKEIETVIRGVAVKRQATKSLVLVHPDAKTYLRIASIPAQGIRTAVCIVIIEIPVKSGGCRGQRHDDAGRHMKDIELGTWIIR